MKNFISILVIFAVLVAGGIFLYVRQSEQQAKEKVAAQLADARRTFAQKARSAAGEADAEGYLRQMRGAIESYKDELKKRVYAGHDELRDVERYKKSVEEKFLKKEVDEAKKKSMLEAYDLVKETYDVVMGASWRPVLTAKGSSDTRLDIYSLRVEQDQDGKPILATKFLFWGIEDSTDVRWGGLSMRLWTTEMQEVKENGRKVEKEVEKVLGKAEGEAQPYVIIQAPGRYVDEFPAYLSIGQLWLGRPLPREAKFVDIEYTYSTRVSGGGETQSVLKWEKLPVPEEWKVRPGETWDADVVEATEEEIAGKDPAAAEEAEKDKKN
jgi:hypothetical protein